MDSFEVILAPRALAQLRDYLDYLNWVLLNEQAARAVYEDAYETLDTLATTASMFPCCSHPVLKKRGYRLIRFQKHRYVMLYRITDSFVSVEAIYHELQDYENLFARD